MVDKLWKLWYSLLVKLDDSERGMIIMLEKYETPEVEFVEMEEDVIVASGSCDGCQGHTRGVTMD